MGQSISNDTHIADGVYLPKAATWQSAFQAVDDTDLLTAFEMRALFPDAHIQRERFISFSKALVAVR